MSRTVDPRPVLNRSTRPRHEAVEAQREHSPQVDRRITGGAAAPATNTRSQQEDEIEPRSPPRNTTKSVPARRCVSVRRELPVWSPETETCTLSHTGVNEINRV